MENKIYKLENKQQLIITNEYIAISKSRFIGYDDMKQKSNMISLKNDFTILNRKHIHEIKFNQKGDVLNISYASEINVDDKFTVKPKIKNEVSEIASSMELSLSLKRTEKKESQIKHLTFNIGYVILSILATVYLFKTSISDDEIQVKKGGFILKIADFLGPVGTSIIGLAIIAFFVYETVKRFKNPAKDIILKK